MINKQTLIDNKKILIEIIIVCALLIGEIIWALVYRFAGFIGEPIYWYGKLIYEPDYALYMSRLLAIFFNVDIFYAMVVLLINFKSEKNKKIFEIFVAELLLVIEVIVVVYCTCSANRWYMWMDRYLVRLLVVFAQINVLYIITLLIINSKDYRLWKAVIAMALMLIAFVTIWLKLTNMTIEVDGDSLKNYKSFMIILTVFASIYVLYAVGLVVFDFVCAKALKKDKDDTAATVPMSD